MWGHPKVHCSRGTVNSSRQALWLNTALTVNKFLSQPIKKALERRLLSFILHHSPLFFPSPLLHSFFLTRPPSQCFFNTLLITPSVLFIQMRKWEMWEENICNFKLASQKADTVSVINNGRGCGGGGGTGVFRYLRSRAGAEGPWWSCALINKHAGTIMRRFRVDCPPCTHTHMLAGGTQFST